MQGGSPQLQLGTSTVSTINISAINTSFGSIYIYIYIYIMICIYIILYIYIYLVGGLEHVLFFHIGNVIIPTDIFQRGRSTTNQSTQGPWILPWPSPFAVALASWFIDGLTVG